MIESSTTLPESARVAVQSSLELPQRSAQTNAVRLAGPDQASSIGWLFSSGFLWRITLLCGSGICLDLSDTESLASNPLDLAIIWWSGYAGISLELPRLLLRWHKPSVRESQQSSPLAPLLSSTRQRHWLQKSVPTSMIHAWPRNTLETVQVTGILVFAPTHQYFVYITIYKSRSRTAWVMIISFIILDCSSMILNTNF